VVKLHIDKSIYDESGKIDPQKTNLVARMGRAFYCRAQGEQVFSIVQPVNIKAIGWDTLPEELKNSTILSGNDLASLAGVAALPNQTDINSF